MDQPPTTCPECGAAWHTGPTCQDSFYQMLYWENERPENGAVHHLMVLCYHLQHPSLFSPEGLQTGIGLLKNFLIDHLTTEDVRWQYRQQVDSRQRAWKVTSRQGPRGSYPRQPRWEMTAGDVVDRGIDLYRESVQAWAASILKALQEVENV